MKTFNNGIWINSEAEDMKKEKLTMIYMNHAVNDTSAFIEKSKEIASNCGLLESEVTQLQLAAWYFDICCSELTIDDECVLSEEAANYLEKLKINPNKLIRFERYNMIEESMLLNNNEKILHDAELSNLADSKRLNRNLILRGIIKRKFGYEYSDTEWLELIYKMISNRSYYTEYAKEKFGLEKLKLTEELMERIQKLKLAS